MLDKQCTAALECGRGDALLILVTVFFVVGLVSALFGFTNVAGASFTVAKFLAAVFLLLFILFLALSLWAGRLTPAMENFPPGGGQ